MSSLHEKLLDELLDPRTSKTEREHAAINEIEKLRQQIADLQKPAPMAHPTAKKARPQDHEELGN